jgi:hypothetical protein
MGGLMSIALFLKQRGILGIFPGMSGSPRI